MSIDTTAPTAPAAPTSYADNVGNVQNPTSSAATTDDATPGINIGTVPAGTTPSLYVDGVKVAATYDAATGTLTPTTPLGAGAHAITYSLTDAAGNESPRSSPALNITVDTSAPTTTASITGISVDSGASASDFITNDNDGLTVSGAISAALVAGEKVQISLDNGVSWVDASTQPTATGTTWSHNAATLTATNTVQVRVTDTAGNTSAAASQLVSIDTTAPTGIPTIGIVLDTNNDGFVNALEKGVAITTTVTVGAPATAVVGDLIEVRNGAAVIAMLVVGTDIAVGGTATVANVVLPAEGAILNVSAVLKDLAGNATATATDTAVLDTTPPTGIPTVTIALDTNNDGTISTAEQGVATTTSLTVGAPATAVVGDVVEVKSGNTVVASLVVGTNITAGGTATVPNVTLPNVGSLMEVTAQLRDAAGNVGGTGRDTAGLPQVIGNNDANDNLGREISSAGDFNGDGFEDLLVTAPSQNGGTNEENQSDAYVLFGGAAGFPSLANIAAITAAQGVRITWATATTATNVQGQSAAGGLGRDVNGDGFDDIVVGGQWSDHAVVIFGRAVGGTIDGSAIFNASTGSNSNGFVLKGPGQMASQVNLIDINNDGYADVFAGDRDSNSSIGGSGSLLVVYGHIGAPGSVAFTGVSFANPAAPVAIGGGAVQAHSVFGNSNTTRWGGNQDFGDHIEYVGDINGDAIEDFVIGMTASSNNGLSQNGAVHLVFGKSGVFASQVDINTLTVGSDYVSFGGSENNEFLGGGTFTTRFGGGTSSNAGGNFTVSHSMSALGDVNGDGISDFAIGSPDWGDGADDGNAPGRVYVLFGKTNGWSDINNIGTGLGTNGFIITGGASIGTDAGLGNGIRGMGDVNGDGLDDFLIGAPGADTSLTDNGAAYLVYGRVGGLTSLDLVTAVASGQAVKFVGIAADDMMGANVALGDWNGDGISVYSFPSSDSSLGASDAGRFDVYYGAQTHLTQSFTSGNDTITSGASSTGSASIVGGVDRVSGGQGNDTITGIGSSADTGNAGLFDVAYGGQGNDTVAIVGTNFTRLDGGLGLDILRVDSTGTLTLNFSNLGNKVQNFEVIDLGTSASAVNGNHTVMLRLADVLNLTREQSGSIQSLTIRGDSGDTVDLDLTKYATSTNQIIDGVTYNVYSHSDLSINNTLDNILIQSGMQVI